MKNIKVLVVLLSGLFINVLAQDSVYVLQTDGQVAGFAIANVDSIVFQRPEGGGIVEPSNAELLFHVSFDGGSAVDQINNITPTVVGTPTFGADKASAANNAYQGAADSYLEYAIADTTWMDQDLTIALWHKNANPTTSGRAGMVTLWNAVGGKNGIAALRRDKGYSSNWGLESGDTWCGSSASAETASGGSTNVADMPYTNDWQFIVYTVNGSDVSLYVDGVLSMTKTLATPISWKGVKTLSIGSGLPNYTIYNYGTVLGQLDEVMIYDQALSTEQIQALMQ